MQLLFVCISALHNLEHHLLLFDMVSWEEPSAEKPDYPAKLCHKCGKTWGRMLTDLKVQSLPLPLNLSELRLYTTSELSALYKTKQNKARINLCSQVLSLKMLNYFGSFGGQNKQPLWYSLARNLIFSSISLWDIFLLLFQDYSQEKGCQRYYTFVCPFLIPSQAFYNPYLFSSAKQ